MLNLVISPIKRIDPNEGIFELESIDFTNGNSCVRLDTHKNYWFQALVSGKSNTV